MSTTYAPIFRVQLVREGKVSSRPKISGPGDVHHILKEMFSEADREMFVVCFFTTSNTLIGVNVVSVGSIDGAPVCGREVFKPAILANAASVILAHNHPSGSLTPSHEDKIATEMLCKAGKFLGIEVLDHIIFGEDAVYSMREHGHFDY